MNPKATLITAVAVCSFTGFLIGRISSQSGSSSSGEGVGGGFRSKREAPGSVVRPRASGSSRGRDRGLSSGSPDSLDSLASLKAFLINSHDLSWLERGESWLRFVNGLSPSETEDAVVILRRRDLADVTKSEYAILLAHWAKHDPIAALDYASKNPDTPFARNTILTTWAISDPLAAIQWAENNHDGKGVNPWMVGVIRGIADSDPQRAAELLDTMPQSDERSEALLEVIGPYLDQDADAARSWAISIADERLRSEIITCIAENGTDPQGTAEWLLANSGEHSNTYDMCHAMQNMTDADPQAAVAYFDGITDEKFRKYAFNGIVSGMASKNPRNAFAFIESHPSLANDSATSSVVVAAAELDPALGATILISTLDDRDNLHYLSYMARWMRKDFDGVAAWIEQNKNELPAPILRLLDEDVAEHARKRAR